MSLAILTQHLLRDFPHRHEGEKRKINVYYITYWKKPQRNLCGKKRNKRKPEAENIHEIIHWPKDKFPFYHILMEKLSGWQRKYGVTALSLRFPVLSKPSVTIGQTTYSKHIWVVIYFHYSALCFKGPSVAKAPLVPAVTFIVATAPVRRTFLHITNMWSPLRICPQKATGFKLILDHLSSNTLVFSFS